MIAPMHPRNLHRDRYDLKSLIQTTPELEKFVIQNPLKQDTIDFSRKEAVKTLNQALLKTFYGIHHWDVPEEFLCPPIPGRADYLHHLADLLGENKTLRGLDIGTGATCIYPLLGNAIYQWKFRASELHPKAFSHAQRIIRDNKLSTSIEVVLQTNPNNIFKGVIAPGDSFDFTMCNPPFHASAADARTANERKWKKLGKKSHGLNFGGQSTELWCEGGERAFIKSMIEESILFKQQCLWFSTLVSKEDNLPPLQAAVKKAGAKRIQVVDMGQGQKKSRFLAWSFVYITN
jgi:23S rRNA (adenine1618-N6)-methyltransferase